MECPACGGRKVDSEEECAGGQCHRVRAGREGLRRADGESKAVGLGNQLERKIINYSSFRHLLAAVLSRFHACHLSCLVVGLEGIAIQPPPAKPSPASPKMLVSSCCVWTLAKARCSSNSRCGEAMPFLISRLCTLSCLTDVSGIRDADFCRGDCQVYIAIFCHRFLLIQG